MNYKIALIRGDGIGPEVVNETLKTLAAVGERFGHSFSYVDVPMGGCATDAFGVSYPEGTTELCKSCDAILLGAVGGPKWDGMSAEKRPETALLRIRSELGLFANLRPATLRQPLAHACPLRGDIAAQGIDMLIVRELTGGIYFGARERHETADRGMEASDLMIYSEYEIERIGRVAFDLAQKRGKKLTCVHKANVLENSRLWRERMHQLCAEYPDVAYQDMYVDNAAMQIVRAPSEFDVIVTGNMFGDILSDEASMVTGSIGLLPSASLGESGLGLYEPIHGSAPDIAGQDKANPIATILSAAMMLKYSFNLTEEAQAIEEAVDAILEAGYRTSDMPQDAQTKLVGTLEMGNLISEKVKTA